VAEFETFDERIDRLLAHKGSPSGDLPQAATVTAVAPPESAEERIDRLTGGLATPQDTREVDESPEGYLPPVRQRSLKTFQRQERFLSPEDTYALPEGMAAADPEEPASKAALRGGLRTVQQAIELANALDPWGPLKKRVGAGPPQDFGKLASYLGVDLSELQMERGGARFAEKATEELLAGAMVAIPWFRGAQAAGTTLKARRFIGPLLRFPAERPAAFAVGEVAASVGAGTGRALAPEGTGMQIGGAAVGAVTPTAVAPLRRLVTVPVGNLIQRGTWRAAPQAMRVRQKAGKQLLTLVGETSEAGEKTIAKISRSEGLMRPTGARPSLIQAARGEPGLKAFETRRTAGESPYAVAINKQLTEQRARAQEAVAEELNDLAQLNRFEGGDGSLLARAVETEPPSFDAKALVDAKLTARAEQAAGLMEEQIVESQRRVADFVSEQTHGGTSTNFSAVLREGLEAEAERVFKPFDDVYNDLDDVAEAAGARVQNTELTASYDKLLRRSTQAEGTGLPSDVERTLKTLTGKMKRPSRRTVGMGEYIPFKELRGLKRRVNREIRALSRQPEGRSSVASLMEVKHAINRTLDLTEDGASRIRFVEGEGASRKLVERPADAARIANTYVSNDRSFSEAAERFRKGVTGQILEPQRAPPAASATAGLYFRVGKGKGQLEAAESFLRASDSNPELRQLMDDYVVARAWEATNHPERGPVLANLRKFQRDHAEALGVFPESSRKIQNLDSLVAEAEKRQLQKVASLKNWEHSAAGRWLQATDPSAAIRGAMKRGPGAMRQLLTQVGDAEGRRGVADIMWSEIQKRAVRYGDLGPGTSLYVEPNAFHKLVNEYAPIIRVVQGQEQVTRLRRIAQMAEIAFQGKVPETARAQQRSLLEKAGNMPLGWTYNRIYNLKTRLIRGGLYGLRWMARRDRGQIEALLDRALVDTQLSKDLLTEAVSEQAQKAVVRRLRGNLISLGYRVPEMEEEEQE
jgi:hypothetical protein